MMLLRLPIYPPSVNSTANAAAPWKHAMTFETFPSNTQTSPGFTQRPTEAFGVAPLDQYVNVAVVRATKPFASVEPETGVLAPKLTRAPAKLGVMNRFPIALAINASQSEV
jgi:hypothetical protein